MPAVASQATDGVIVTRADRRGSTAGTVVRAWMPAASLVRDDAKSAPRSPGTISTRGLTRQTRSA